MSDHVAVADSRNAGPPSVSSTGLASLQVHNEEDESKQDGESPVHRAYNVTADLEI